MKFGKYIQAQQVPGWSAYYLDYKFLKKIISSLAANRPASEAAALALGTRPSDILGQSLPATPNSSTNPSPTAVPDDHLRRPPIFPGSGQDFDRGSDFRAHKAAFFFKLERELEKINTFYLQKEAELKLRMETLLSKRRAAAMRGLPDSNGDITQNNVEWSAVEEGFRLLERDLGKLQQFVEINGTGFRKILKKFDKRSKSTTKELYLSRQVEVQPVFNRQLIAELADTVAICLLDLTDLSSGLKFEGSNANDMFIQQLLMQRTSPSGPFRDLENNLRIAVVARDTGSITDCMAHCDLLAKNDGGKTLVTRILWNVIVEAPVDMADLILSSLPTPFDFQFVDDINGRTCLHEAAIVGALRLVDLCIHNGVRVDQADLYGRTALHYACMKGHPTVCKRLLETNVSPNILDRDNYSPLIYATMKGNVHCARVLLLEGKVSVEPTKPPGDLIPLSLASQSGHVDVVLLLLEHKASCLPNTNGEYPMHLAAREGHVEVCKLFVNREGWDTPDKYHEWSPLFHAARYGRDSCVEVLLEAGARFDATDELGHLAVHYAAWYGHQRCLTLLLEAARCKPHFRGTAVVVGSPVSSPGVSEFDIDQIPSLSLPPPIMPHRVYGHNYLDKCHLVQVTIGHSSPCPENTSGVRIHHRLISPAFEDEYLRASTPLKLVMTTSPHVNSAPYSVALPLRGERELFAFHIGSLSDLSLEFSICPNFGTKTIGRAVALPSLFAGVENNQAFTLPILDVRLHTVGEVDFEVNIVTAFEGVTLEIGGDFETYWKSLALPHFMTQPVAPWPHRSSLIGSAQASPSVHSIESSGKQFLTISSLQGSYVHVVIQVTRDLHPVVYADWSVPEPNFDLGVSDITLAQFDSLGRRLGKDIRTMNAYCAAELPSVLARSMISLARLLKMLPPNVNLSLELAYPSRTRTRLSTRRQLDPNKIVDSVLRTIYNVSAALEDPYTRHKIVFVSFSPDVCTLLNWKQPNYPVFFAARCGKDSTYKPNCTALDAKEENDPRMSRIGAAVEFATTNNLLGVFADAALLVQVPSLIDGIRNAGLLVGAHGEMKSLESLIATSSIQGTPVDASLSEGRVIFIDRSTQATDMMF